MNIKMENGNCYTLTVLRVFVTHDDFLELKPREWTKVTSIAKMFITVTSTIC
jgi:hypothetical protein